MTNQDIETFFAVLDHGTMTAAAEALFITQPSLSARLRALEDEVGAPLFHRGKGLRRITLTDAQANELRFRLRQATRPVPASFWEARDGAPATRGGE